MTNLYRSRLNYSYAVVKIQAGVEPLHPSSRSGRLSFRTSFRVVLEVGLRLSGFLSNPENDTERNADRGFVSHGDCRLSWSLKGLNRNSVSTLE